MTPHRHRRSAVSCSIIAILLFAVTAPSDADTIQPTIHGKTYAEWSAQWWKWVRSIPDPDGHSNPITSSGAVDCSIGQAGPVWFLAGTLGGAHIERQCTVPKGKELFFPILTLVFYNGPADEPATEAEKREVLDSILSDRIPGPFGTHVCQLVSTVDGVSTLFSALATTRTQSPAFRLAIGADDVYGGTAGTVDTAAVSDGIWVMLRLPKGMHVLHFEGALCDFDTHEVLAGTKQDVTYTLSVE